MAQRPISGFNKQGRATSESMRLAEFKRFLKTQPKVKPVVSQQYRGFGIEGRAGQYWIMGAGRDPRLFPSVIMAQEAIDRLIEVRELMRGENPAGPSVHIPGLTYWHGSRTNDPLDLSKGGNFGGGLFVSRDRGVAEQYARGDPARIYVIKVPSGLKWLNTSDRTKVSQLVDRVRSLYPDFAEPSGDWNQVTEDLHEADLEANSVWDDPTIQEAANDLGYDGVRTRDHRTLIILDPEKIEGLGVQRQSELIGRGRNPAGPTYAQALVMARHAGQKIGDTSGFQPWLIKSKLDTRSSLVKRHLETEFWRGVEEGEGPVPTATKVTLYKGVTISRTDEGYVTGVDPESTFESEREAKRFIDSQVRGKSNPEGDHPTISIQDIKPGDLFRVNNRRMSARGKVLKVDRVTLRYETSYFGGSMFLRIRKEELVGELLERDGVVYRVAGMGQSNPGVRTRTVHLIRRSV